MCCGCRHFRTRNSEQLVDQSSAPETGRTIGVRRDGANGRALLRQHVGRLDPTIALPEPTTFAELRRAATRESRVHAGLAAMLAAVALSLGRPCLKPCPEPPPIIHKLLASGCTSRIKLPSGEFSYWQTLDSNKEYFSVMGIGVPESSWPLLSCLKWEHDHLDSDQKVYPVYHRQF